MTFILSLAAFICLVMAVALGRESGTTLDDRKGVKVATVALALGLASLVIAFYAGVTS